MLEENLSQLRMKKVKADIIILTANRLVLNYATSIKTYIDMEVRMLKRRNKNKELEKFKELCSKFYDSSKEYRFWMNLRNYVVHCDFPYHGFSESYEHGYKVICKKGHLLEFKNWKQSKNDILAMGEDIDLPSMVFKMSSIIMAFYIKFFTYFGQEIIDSLSLYSEFCKKHNVKQPAFLSTSRLLTKENFTLSPESKIIHLPIDDLYKAFEMLKNNPNVKINYRT